MRNAALTLGIIAGVIGNNTSWYDWPRWFKQQGQQWPSPKREGLQYGGVCGGVSSGQGGLHAGGQGNRTLGCSVQMRGIKTFGQNEINLMGAALPEFDIDGGFGFNLVFGAENVPVILKFYGAVAIPDFGGDGFAVPGRLGQGRRARVFTSGLFGARRIRWRVRGRMYRRLGPRCRGHVKGMVMVAPNYGIVNKAADMNGIGPHPIPRLRFCRWRPQKPDTNHVCFCGHGQSGGSRHNAAGRCTVGVAGRSPHYCGDTTTISGDGWLGIAPSDQVITLKSLDFWRIDNGLIRENWVLAARKSQRSGYMEQRISLITLGAKDMDTEAAFYEALGWSRVETQDGVIAFDLLGQTLGLYPLAALAEDIGVDLDTLGHGAMTLGHNVNSREEVDALMGKVEAAGGKILKALDRGVLGGLSRVLFRSRRSYLGDRPQSVFAFARRRCILLEWPLRRSRNARPQNHVEP
ncbi:hypothetical protein GQR58_000525 [Nymphon striatum]|nr:hypothetical protein GQR58_000525 [Nymphon striatum]